jgi:hypothetical protein
MKLRDHPLLSYHGVSSWPPVWVGKDARPLEQPTSELAILKKVMLPITAPLNRCFITIEYEDKEYLGAVLFDDQFSCHQIYRLLSNHRGKPLRQIGELDVPQAVVSPIIKRRTCKVCGSVDDCEFKVMDDVWKATVPIEYRNQIVCAKCFENFAAERQIQLLRRKEV